MDIQEFEMFKAWLQAQTRHADSSALKAADADGPAADYWFGKSKAFSQVLDQLEQPSIASPD